jgi:hypothetical protein
METRWPVLTRPPLAAFEVTPEASATPSHFSQPTTDASTSGAPEILEFSRADFGTTIENYRAVTMQEAVVKMQEEQQEAKKLGMLQ